MLLSINGEYMKWMQINRGTRFRHSSTAIHLEWFLPAQTVLHNDSLINDRLSEDSMDLRV